MLARYVSLFSMDLLPTSSKKPDDRGSKFPWNDATSRYLRRQQSYATLSLHTSLPTAELNEILK